MNGGDNTNFDGGNTSDAPNPSASNPERQRHGVIGARRYRGPSEEQNYSAATNLASNPSTPEFFSEAVMASTLAPQPRKSHKKLIIAILGIILVVAIIIAVIFAITNNLGSGTTGVRKTFNQYANYLLYGEEKDTDITEEYNNLEPYYINEAKKDRDALEKYLQTAKQKLDTFAEKYNSLAEKDQSVLKHITLAQQELDLFSAIYLEPLPSTRELIEYYGENGLSKTKDYLATNFERYSINKIRTTTEYYEQYYAKSSAFLDALSQLDEYRCVNKEQGKITTRCLNNNDDARISGLISVYDEYKTYENEKNSQRANNAKYVYVRIWYIKDLLYNEK